MDRLKKVLGSRLLNNLLPILLFLAVGVLFSILTNGMFLGANSIKTIINQALVTGIIATGAVFIFATNNVNIALGGTTVISAIVGVVLFNLTNSIIIMSLGCIITAVVILIISNILSMIFRIPVVSVTVIMMGLLAALQELIMMKYVTLSIPYAVVDQANKLQLSRIIFVISFLVFAYLFCLTKIGRSLKMIGENPVCANLTGIHLPKMLMLAFIIAGIGAGIGAILFIFRSGSISASSCQSLNMDVMLAIVLGGMPVTGGYKSKITAGVIGSFLVVMLNSGLLMVGIDATIVQAVRGVCFLILIVLSNKRPDGLPVKGLV